ncbi:hypothetical protein [Sphingomonas rosea]|uniref:hypothetical protein n=1 Tax=Sphingomonas rosea TaxID=335605 RepID=UPI0031D8EACF
MAGCTDWKPAQAMVTSIDRTCMIVERKAAGSVTDRMGKERVVADQRTYEGRCDEVDGWAEEKAKRSMTIDGKAAIHLSYTGVDGKSHTATVNVTGQDPEFYDVSTGSTVDIRFDPENPERVSFS